MQSISWDASQAQQFGEAVLAVLWPDMPSFPLWQSLRVVAMDPYHPEYFGGVPGYGPLMVTVDMRDGTRWHRATAATEARAVLTQTIQALATWWTAPHWHGRWPG